VLFSFKVLTYNTIVLVMIGKIYRSNKKLDGRLDGTNVPLVHGS
jgi:hypothetical protein